MHLRDEPGVMWCCAMMNYRILLFEAKNSTADVTEAAPAPASSLNNWNASCWPGNAPPRPALLPKCPPPKYVQSGTLRFFFATAGKAATNNMTVMGLCITGKLCQRSLRFTTASYADTVRAQEVLETYFFPRKAQHGVSVAYESQRLSLIHI